MKRISSPAVPFPIFLPKMCKPLVNYYPSLRKQGNKEFGDFLITKEFIGGKKSIIFFIFQRSHDIFVVLQRRTIILIFLQGIHAKSETYRGNTDSTPTPATSLRNLKVVFNPAFLRAITIPLRVETRLLFSGTSCLKN